MKKETTFTITNISGEAIKRIPFERIKTAVLGKRHVLSLVFIKSNLSRKLNAIYRGKPVPANVLSFPLSRNEGEVFIDVVRARREASQLKRPLRKHVSILFVHALFHLKGLRHGSTMEREEKKVLGKFFD